MDGNNEIGRLQTPKIEESNEDGKIAITYLYWLTLKFQEPECKIEVPSDEAANPPSSLNELSSQGKFK